jgi:myo-inositol catabolism protein IolS
MEIQNTQATSPYPLGPGFGCASLSGEGGGYGFGRVTDLESEILLKRAWEQDLRVFDTAPIYGFGLAEERLGKYLPSEALIVGKGGVSWHPNRRVNMSNEPEVIESMFFESLRRLRREKIYCYMIHWPDPRVDIRKPYEVLAKLKAKGLVDCIGLSNPHLEDFALAEEIAPVQVVQMEASYLESTNLLNLRSELEKNQILNPKWWMGWGTFAKGILTGRVYEGRKYDPSDARSWAPWWKKMNLTQMREASQPLLKVAHDFSISPAAAALIYSLDILKVDCPLVGFKNIEDFKFLEEIQNLETKKRSEIGQGLLGE